MLTLPQTLRNGLAAAILALPLTLSGSFVATAVAQQAVDVDPLEAEGRVAITAWLAALVVGTADAVGPVLAPEFQILRADGTGYDRAGYLAGGLPVIPALPQILDLIVTRSGDVLVARYVLDSPGQLVAGVPVQARAPRLTVFRRDGDSWLVVAHANFAAATN